MDEKNIREELSNILVDDPTNYSRIMELSSKLASFDSDKIRENAVELIQTLIKLKPSAAKGPKARIPFFFASTIAG